MALKKRIADLRHRLAIQANTPTVDAYGERSNSWATLDTVYGAIRPISANEPMRAMQPQMDVTHEITIRWADYFGAGDVRLKPEHRFTYDSRNFIIKGIMNLEERNRFYVCLCRETE